MQRIEMEDLLESQNISFPHLLMLVLLSTGLLCGLWKYS